MLCGYFVLVSFYSTREIHTERIHTFERSLSSNFVLRCKRFGVQLRSSSLLRRKFYNGEKYVRRLSQWEKYVGYSLSDDDKSRQTTRVPSYSSESHRLGRKDSSRLEEKQRDSCVARIVRERRQRTFTRGRCNQQLVSRRALKRLKAAGDELYSQLESITSRRVLPLFPIDPVTGHGTPA